MNKVFVSKDIMSYLMENHCFERLKIALTYGIINKRFETLPYTKAICVRVFFVVSTE